MPLPHWGIALADGGAVGGPGHRLGAALAALRFLDRMDLAAALLRPGG
jgi:hypothetical protein